MYSMAVFACIYGPIDKKYAISVVLCAIPMLFYLWINDPETTYMMYLASNNVEKINSIYLFLSHIFAYFNIVVLISYMAFPLVRCFVVYNKIKISYNKKQVILLSLILLLIDVFYFGFFVVGSFKNLSNYSNDFLKNATTYAQSIGYYSYFMPVIILALIIVLTVFIFKFNVVYTNEMAHAKDVRRRIRSVSKDIYGVLHSYKNTLFSIVISSRKGVNHTNEEETKTTFLQIEKTAGESMKNLAKMLDVFNNVKINCEYVNVVDCIYEAVSRLPQSNITINFDIKVKEDRSTLFIDKYYMTEALYNLLINSFEAIKVKNISNGKIDIEVYHEAGWLSIDITDNGCGIPKKNYKKIFKPLNSTKNTQTNWGVGLAYVHNIVYAHMGVISVRSAEEKYTKFEIILPIAEKETDMKL